MSVRCPTDTVTDIPPTHAVTFNHFNLLTMFVHVSVSVVLDIHTCDSINEHHHDYHI